MDLSSLPLQTLARYLEEGSQPLPPEHWARYVSKGMLCAIDLPGAKEEWETEKLSESERVFVHAQSQVRVRVSVDFQPKLDDPQAYLSKVSKWMHFVEEKNRVAGSSRAGCPAALSWLEGTDPFGRPQSLLAACIHGKGRMYVAIASTAQGELSPVMSLAMNAVLGIRPL
jgi:hypothetical protein